MEIWVGAKVAVAVWDRRTLTGSGFWTTTSGASAEFMVIVRVWPSGFVGVVGFGSVGL